MPAGIITAPGRVCKDHPRRGGMSSSDRGRARAPGRRRRAGAARVLGAAGWVYGRGGSSASARGRVHRARRRRRRRCGIGLRDRSANRRRPAFLRLSLPAGRRPRGLLPPALCRHVPRAGRRATCSADRTMCPARRAPAARAPGSRVERPANDLRRLHPRWTPGSARLLLRSGVEDAYRGARGGVGAARISPRAVRRAERDHIGRRRIGLGEPRAVYRRPKRSGACRSCC